MDALLGHTGFVGSHLRENLDPDTTLYFNSKNLPHATVGEFRNVYCACVPAVKWWANKHPSEDLSVCREILAVLTSVRFTGRFVLISTIDVHDCAFRNQSEDCEHPSAEPYGKHRLMIESELRRVLASRLLVVRLPALFGVGLKKNILFDLLEQHMVHRVNVNTAFQWYSLEWLWGDLQHVKSTRPDIETVNLYPEQVESGEIVRTFFPDQLSKVSHGQRLEYDQRSKHDAYWRSKSQVMEKMGEYVQMRSYIVGENHMAISNMAWEPIHDNHALFLMERFGIRRVEMLPTKYATWDSFFQDPTGLTNRFESRGIAVYSMQSLLYGIPGDFLVAGRALQDHLKKVLVAAKTMGCSVVVLGSPKTRVAGLTESELARQLHGVQSTVPCVKLCLEANSAEYGCHVGTDLASVQRTIDGTDVCANMDTGNLLMTGETAHPDNLEKVAHVQISAPYLRPLTAATYVQLDAAGVTSAIQKILEPGTVSVSLEVQCGAGMLGEQVRLFCKYCAAHFGSSRTAEKN